MARLRGAKKNEEEVLEVETVEVEAVEEVKAEAKDETISVIDKAVETAKAMEVETTKVVAKEPNVRVNPKQDIRTYVGDQWYNLKAGKVVSVPKTVKDKLQKAGLLNAI